MELSPGAQAIIEALKAENALLRQRIAELERLLGLDSNTSSKPPSSDGLLLKACKAVARAKAGGAIVLAERINADLVVKPLYEAKSDFIFWFAVLPPHDF